jgi:hypothetical protein
MQNINYKMIDNLIKINKSVYMFYQYGLENYTNRIIYTKNKIYLFDGKKLSLVKNLRMINDITKNCISKIKG